MNNYISFSVVVQLQPVSLNFYTGQEVVFDVSQPISQGLPYNPTSIMNLYETAQIEKESVGRDVVINGNPMYSNLYIQRASKMDYLHINLLYCGGLLAYVLKNCQYIQVFVFITDWHKLHCVFFSMRFYIIYKFRYAYTVGPVIIAW